MVRQLRSKLKSCGLRKPKWNFSNFDRHLIREHLENKRKVMQVEMKKKNEWCISNQDKIKLRKT